MHWVHTTYWYIVTSVNPRGLPDEGSQEKQKQSYVEKDGMGGEGMEIYYEELYKGPAGGGQPGDPGEPLFQFNPQSHLF